MVLDRFGIEREPAAVTNPENPMSWSHAEIKLAAEQMKPSVSQEIAQNWTELAGEFEGLANRFDQSMRAFVAESWQGRAADAASGAVVRLAASAVKTAGQFTMLGGNAGLTGLMAADFAREVPPVRPQPAGHEPSVAVALEATDDERIARHAMTTYYVGQYQNQGGEISVLTGPVLPSGLTAGPVSAPGRIPDPTASGGAAGAAVTSPVAGAAAPAGQPVGGTAGTPEAAVGQSVPQLPSPTEAQSDSSGHGGADRETVTQAAGYHPGASLGTPSMSGSGTGGGGLGASTSVPVGPPVTPVAPVSPVGRGGPGVGAGVVRGPAAGTPGSGAAGMPGMPPVPGRGKGSEPKEHKTNKYLYGVHNGEELLYDERKPTGGLIAPVQPERDEVEPSSVEPAPAQAAPTKDPWG